MIISERLKAYLEKNIDLIDQLNIKSLIVRCPILERESLREVLKEIGIDFKLTYDPQYNMNELKQKIEEAVEYVVVSYADVEEYDSFDYIFIEYVNIRSSEDEDKIVNEIMDELEKRNVDYRAVTCTSRMGSRSITVSVDKRSVKN